MNKIGEFLQGCMRHSRLMFFFLGVLVVVGAYAIVVMPKQEFPIFTVRQGVIVAVYPGATPEQIEEQVAKPLEEFIFTYKEVKRKKTYTISSDGQLLMMVELNDDVHNKDEVWSKIKLGLELVRQSLPQGVLALIANDDFGDTSALLITLEANDKSYRELEDYLTTLEGKLRRVESVANLRRYGLQKEQIGVYISREKLAGYGLNLGEIMAKLSLRSTTIGGAKVANSQIDIPLYIEEPFSSEEELSEQIIASDNKGNALRLKDIAQIKREYPKPESYVYNNGKTALVVSLQAKDGVNVVSFGKEVDRVLNEFQKELPASIKMQRIADQPKVVDTSVKSFLRDLSLSILVVIGVMLLLFSLRSAFVAALTIPISVAICIAIMYIVGIELDTVTLAVLIVVLGMIVDNSVIVIDAYVKNLDDGLRRWGAAVKSAKEYFGSILLATICLCSLFYPLLITMTGMFRDFLTDFPRTFTIALMTSFAIAMVFVPFVEYKIIKKGNKQIAEENKDKFNLFEKVQNIYETMLRWVFRHAWLTLFLAIASIVVGFIVFFSLPQRMMPFVDRNQFAVEIYLPQGTALSQTKAVADSVYEILHKDKRVTSVTSFIGCGAPRFQMAYAPQPASKHYAQLIVNTLSNKATLSLLDSYTNSLAHRYPNAYVKLKQLDYSVVTAPIEVRLYGDNFGQIKQYADTVMAALRPVKGLTRLHINNEEPLPAINVKLDPVKASQAGVKSVPAALELAMLYGGATAGNIWEGNYPLKVVLKTHDNSKEPDAFDKIGDEYLISTGAKAVALRQIADIQPTWYDGQLVRRNGVRCLTIMADIERGTSESKTIKAVNQIVKKKILPVLPKDILCEIGGGDENNRESSAEFPGTLAISFGLIFLFLLLNFKRLALSLTALASILLCVPGAVLGLVIFKVDFSLTVLLGVIALLGINMRNAIIMFQHAEDKHHKEGLKAKEAAFDAGCRRMVPIFLTSATTAVGIVPMILSKSSLWAPMGVVILTGTIISMLLIVLVLPVAYWKLYRHE